MKNQRVLIYLVLSREIMIFRTTYVKRYLMYCISSKIIYFSILVLAAKLTKTELIDTMKILETRKNVALLIVILLGDFRWW